MILKEIGNGVLPLIVMTTDEEGICGTVLRTIEEGIVLRIGEVKNYPIRSKGLVCDGICGIFLPCRIDQVQHVYPSNLNEYGRFIIQQKHPLEKSRCFIQRILLGQMRFQIVGDVLLAEEFDKAAAFEHGLCLSRQAGDGDLCAVGEQGVV